MISQNQQSLTNQNPHLQHPSRVMVFSSKRSPVQHSTAQCSRSLSSPAHTSWFCSLSVPSCAGGIAAFGARVYYRIERGDRLPLPPYSHPTQRRSGSGQPLSCACCRPMVVVGRGSILCGNLRFLPMCAVDMDSLSKACPTCCPSLSGTKR